MSKDWNHNNRVSQKFCNICIRVIFWNKHKKFDGTELMDLASSDYYLLPCIAHSLHSRRFNNQDEVEASIKEFFI